MAITATEPKLIRFDIQLTDPDKVAFTSVENGFRLITPALEELKPLVELVTPESDSTTMTATILVSLHGFSSPDDDGTYELVARSSVSDIFGNDFETNQVLETIVFS